MNPDVNMDATYIDKVAFLLHRLFDVISVVWSLVSLLLLLRMMVVVVVVMVMVVVVVVAGVRVASFVLLLLPCREFFNICIGYVSA